MVRPRHAPLSVPSVMLALLLLAARSGFAEEHWRVLGLSADGLELAAVVTTLDAAHGFHCRAVARLGLPGGRERGRTQLVDAARLAQLRARGDYDLLRYEEDAARRAALAALVAGGFVSCLPLALRAKGEDVTLELPDGPFSLGVTHDGATGRLMGRAADGGGPVELATVPLPAVRVSPFETVRYRLAGAQDVLLCGDTPRWLVVVVGTEDPPPRELAARQHVLPILLLVGAAAAPPVAAPPQAEPATAPSRGTLRSLLRDEDE